MSGIGRPRGRPLGSGGKGKGKVPSLPSLGPGGKGNGKVPSLPSSSQQRNVAQHMTPPISTPSPSSSNAGVPLGTSHVPSPATERTSTPQYPQPPTHVESETMPPTEVNDDHNSQPQQFIPFGDPTLPGPHNMNLPWGNDPLDNKVWIYTLKGYFYPDDNATKDISKAIKSMFDGPYNNWKCCGDNIKKMWFKEWAKGYKWIGEQESTIKAMWECKAKDLLRKIMSRARENMSRQPSWIPDNVWAQLLDVWQNEDYQTLRCVAVANRHSDTGGSLHTQGSKNQLKHELELAQRLRRMPHKNELFKKCHTRKGTQDFVDKRSSDAYEKFETLQVESQPQSSESGDNGSCTQPKPIDYDALMIEAVGGRNAKGRVYGLGLDGSMRVSASTSKSKQYANYTDIVRSMSNEVEARLRQKIAEQQQTINRVLARQNKILSFFAKHVNIDLDAMDLDEDDRSIGDTTHGSNPANDTDADDQY